MEDGIWMNKDLSSRVLTIGCKYSPPRGGIAQVLWNYDNYIFEDFKFIENSRKSNGIINMLIALWAVIKMIANLVIDKEIKIVHIHTASEVSFLRSTIFLKVAKCFRKKVVMHIHGGGFEKYYKSHTSFVTKNLKRCDKIITLSQDWVDFYASIGFASTCVENVIPEPVIKESAEIDGLVHMLFMGLIIERKGIYDLLDVLAAHIQEFEGKIMLHIGGNGEVDELKHRIKSQGLENIVKFEGWVGDDKKIELLNLCDVFVLPSYVEGLPLSILEAMSYNMAIVSSRVGGIPSLVKDGHNGVLFDPGDKEALYNAIKLFIDNKLLLNEMGKVNSEMVVGFFPRNVAKKLAEIYKQLL